MKNHQYLTTGLLESYLLGGLTASEREEAEHLLANDPELAVQLEELELDLESHFLQEAVPPPPGIGMVLQERLFGTEMQKWQPDSEPHSHREAPEAARSPYVDVEVSDTQIRVHKYWRPAFIAVFVLSKVFLILGLYFYFKAASLEQEINRLKATAPTGQPAPQSPGR